MTDLTKQHLDALSQLQHTQLLQADDKEMDAAVKRFKTFFTKISQNTIQENLHHIYAEDVWFSDNLVTLHNIQGVRKYFLNFSKFTENIQVNLLDSFMHHHVVYIKWNMTVTMKVIFRKKTISTLGISELHFDTKGRIVFQQDYSDTGYGFYEQIPLLSPLLRLFKLFFLRV